MEKKLKESKSNEVMVSGEFKRASDVEIDNAMVFGEVPIANKATKSDKVNLMNRKSNVLFDQANNRNSGIVRNTIQT